MDQTLGIKVESISIFSMLSHVQMTMLMIKIDCNERHDTILNLKPVTYKQRKAKAV